MIKRVMIQARHDWQLAWANSGSDLTFRNNIPDLIVALFESVFRIRIRIRIRSDPYHLAGSGSASGNVDLDPGTKKNRDKLAYKSTKIIKI